MDHMATAMGDAKQVRLGQSHGYRIQGDTAALNAQLSVLDRSALQARSWALQLWACDGPYAGGPLTGRKVAEAPIALAESPDAQPWLSAEGRAALPPEQREYAMVLVLAAGAGGEFGELHDFANYPLRERFVAPRFEAAPALVRADDGSLQLALGSVLNAREDDHLSGSLRVTVELGEPTGGASDALLVVDLGQLAGGARFVSGPVSVPEAAREGVVVRLGEWTAQGYVTRDRMHCAALAGAQPLEVVASAPVASAPVASAPVASAPARVSLARATSAELAAVPGLNAKLAAAIVKERPYTSLDQLERVRGIGAKMVAKLRAHLSVD